MMNRIAQRNTMDNVGFGVLAGLIFGAGEVIATAWMGRPAILPLRLFASILLGRQALATTPAGTAVVLGIVTHLILSGIFGLVYGALLGRQPAERTTSWGNQAAYGALFGLALWVVNFQIIARVFYPWFLNQPQFLQAVAHAAFFGLPLALFCAASERRLRVPRPAT